MKIEGSGRYETLKEADYHYIKYLPKYKEHILHNNFTGKNEIFIANHNGSGWRLIYKNMHLEFCSVID